MKTYIGIDNGVSGTIAVLSPSGNHFGKIPTKKEQDYTKAKKIITRLDYGQFKAILEPYKDEEVIVVMERPMVNPTRFLASASALRCHEAELICIEELCLPLRYIDSKEWQRSMLPKGADDLKKASLDIGNRLFPNFKDYKHLDRDSLLIAEYARQKNL